MKKSFKLIIIFTIIILFVMLVFFPHVSNFIGWYGYRKWQYRQGTDNIAESKKRNVFVRELNYKIVDSAGFKNIHFIPYLEKGFKYGKHSSEDTRIMSHTDFPYNISYERNLKDSLVLYFIENDLKKLDSSDAVWGYSKTPYLKDTLTLKIEGTNQGYGLIQIW